jgi:undecaprenyl-diphosphatase
LAEAARRAPHWLVLIFGEVTDFGKSSWFLWPTGLLLIAIAAMSSEVLARFGRLTLAALAVRTSFLFIAIALPSAVVSVIKRLIGRARPFIGEHADPFLYKQLVWRPDYASMPSGHATTAFAAAVAIALVWPRLRVPMLIYCLLIAVSRVVLDAHYVSDVVAGAVVGTVGALLVRDWFAARRLGFVIGADGSVRALPGPSFPRIKRVARCLLAP